MSTLVKSQHTEIKKSIPGGTIVINLQYDDECGNGHNSFSITADVYKNKKHVAGGCIHDTIVKYAPELEKYIKWHLTSSDGPMHYLANSLYHAGDKDCWGLRKGEKSAKSGRVGKGNIPNLEYARSSAVWPEAKLKDFTKSNLEKRLPGLMAEFKADMIELGFKY